jgi:processive 1,2-diacylglycerol beta-glucosyltransferase
MKPDITICTHFLPAEIISYLISKQKVSARLSIVVTDFDFHAMWLSRVFHRYFVALEETFVHLKMLGFPEERITVSGIPIDPKFAKVRDNGAFRKQHKLRADTPLLLLSAGALSVGPVERVVRVLRHLQHPAQIVVLCGKNDSLQKRVTEQVRKSCPNYLSFHVLGFTEEMDRWMSAADLFIGKPGGLISSEAMAKQTPMVIFSPIPGQEERNSDQLLEKGVAIKCNEITTMAYKIDKLLNQPEKLKQMKKAAERLAKPNAAHTIVSTLLQNVHRDPITVPLESQEKMVEAARKK